jgi:4-hydroxybenzoate polyprenyltransferase
MSQRQTKIFVMKWVSLLSTIRVYNIVVMVMAQYLSALFILSNQSFREVFFDINLFIIVLASALSIASGYIINSFYDNQKDLINRPKKTMLDRLVSQKTKLNVYFAINFFVFVIAFFVSFKAVLFFSFYIFSLWFYSHKVKKIPFLGNLYAALLAVFPFFGILLYYKNFHDVIYGHAIYLYIIILIREMIKDLENIVGDIAQDYRTIPIILGVDFSKKIMTILVFISLIPVYFLVDVFDVAFMETYFYFSYLFLIVFVIKLWKSESKMNYVQLHNLLKFVIVSGVFSIVLTQPTFLKSILSFIGL